MDRHRSFAARGHPMAELVGSVVKRGDDRAEGKEDVDRSRHTHAFMDGSNRSRSSPGFNRGWMTLPPELHDMFLTKMASALDLGFDTCVSERVMGVRRAFADFDLLTAEEKDTHWMLEVARAWVEGLRECWPEADAEKFITCVLLRSSVEKVVTQRGKKVKKVKSGMHLIAPNLHVTEGQLVVARDAALRILQRSKHLLQRGDGTWPKILDPKFDTLRMLGNQKSEKCKACRGHVSRRRSCVECGGRALFINHDAVYDLEHILDGDGEVHEELEAKVAPAPTLTKLQLTCLTVPPGTEANDGFVCPDHVHPRARAAAEKDARPEDRGQKTKKDKELLERGDPLFESLASACRQLHPAYGDMTLREIVVVRDNYKKRQKYIMTPWNPNAFPCLNLVSCEPHASEGIYFEVDRRKGQVLQGCGCKCPKGVEEGRVSGMCRDIKSPGQCNIILPIATRLQMFDFSDKSRAALLDASDMQAMMDTVGRDPYLVQCEAFLTKMCMKLMHSVPILSSMEGMQRQAALAAYMRGDSSNKSMTITERKAEQEKARRGAEEVKRRLEEKVESIAESFMIGGSRGAAMRRTINMEMAEESKTLNALRAVSAGTHQFAREQRQGMGVFGSAAYTHIDKESGRITYYPPRQTLETVKRYVSVSSKVAAENKHMMAGGSFDEDGNIIPLSVVPSYFVPTPEAQSNEDEVVAGAGAGAGAGTGEGEEEAALAVGHML